MKKLNLKYFGFLVLFLWIYIFLCPFSYSLKTPNPKTISASTQLHYPKDLPITEEQTVLMGTDVSILILSSEKERAKNAIQTGFQEIKRIEDLMTDWKESPLEEINRQAGKKPVNINKELMFLLKESKEISKITHGAFDITYAPLGKLWDYNQISPKIPSQEKIQKALDLVGYQNLQLDDKKNTAFLTKPGMRIGLGGIAKGYAVDRAVKKIKQLGFENFAVNAGGDLTVKGRKDGHLWTVGIRHPRRLEENLALLPVSNGTVVTSGDSERYFILNGQRYCHILNPLTGYPATQIQSVTILANKAYWADALATGVFVLGPIEGMKLIESLPHIEGMLVDAHGNIQVSSGLKKGAHGGKFGKL